MKEKLQKIVNSRFGILCDKFCNSVWYIIVIGAICVFSHTLNLPVVGALMLAAAVVPSLLFCGNSFVLMPFLTMCTFVMSEETKPQSGYYNRPVYIVFLCIALVFVLAAFVFNLIYYKKWKKIFKRGYLTLSLAIVTAFLIVGGLGAPSFSWTGVGMAAAIAATMFLPYSLLINCGEYAGRKTIEYFAWNMIVAAIVIFAATVKQYVIHNLSFSDPDKTLIVFGYAISNTAAAFVLISVPITFYMVYIYKHGYLFLAAIGIELLTIYLTLSRAAIAVAVPGTAIVATALCFFKKSGRIGYWIAYGIAVTGTIALAIVYRQNISEIFIALSSGQISSSGRMWLWKSGFEAWKSYPVFGLGIWYLPPINNWYYSFHSTPLTYLYCTGIVGLAAYLYHRYRTVRLVFSTKLTSERVFVALSVFAMLCNALLDIAMTMPPHLLYYGIMLALIECDARKTKAENIVKADIPEQNQHSDEACECSENKETEGEKI